jgi:hypothetical protein
MAYWSRFDRWFRAEIRLWRDIRGPDGVLLDANRVSAVAKNWRTFTDADRKSWFIARVVQYYVAQIRDISHNGFIATIPTCCLLDGLGGYAFYSNTYRKRGPVKKTGRGARPGEVRSGEAFTFFVQTYFPRKELRALAAQIYSQLRCNLVHNLGTTMPLTGNSSSSPVKRRRYPLRNPQGADTGVRSTVDEIQVDHFIRNAMVAVSLYLRDLRLATHSDPLNTNFLDRHKAIYR